MTLKESFVSLKGVRFHAFHGVGRQERLTGTDFVVDLRVKIYVGKAVGSDNVADTLSYDRLYTIAEEEMRVPSNLLEHVAGRMARRIAQEWEQAEEIFVAITKENPPMGGQMEGATVELCFKKD